MEISATPTAVQRPVAQQAPETARSVISSDFETFLRMLTAQIQNQDPLNPTPSDEFAVQLATFAGVEQQVRTNELLEAMGGTSGVSGIGRLADWIGMDARAPVPARFDGRPLQLWPQPAAGADRAQLVVRNDTGREVQRIEVTPSSDPVSWNGQREDGIALPPGNYSFELVSFRDGVPMASGPVETYDRVTEVQADKDKVFVIFASGARVEANSVTALRS